MKNQRIWILIVYLFVSFDLLAKEGVSKSSQQDHMSTRKNIEQVIDNYVSNGAFEGVVLVSKSGEKIFEKAYGFENLAERKPITNNSSFQIASLSKPIAATMTLILVEQGKLELNNTLASYFPEFNNTNRKQITIHHLLSHTSGVPDVFTIEGWFNSSFHNSTSEQEFIGIIAKLPLSSEPGVNYHYSTPGYFLLGKIIEKVTGSPFSESVQKHIFTPLNMANSGVAKGGKKSSDVVNAYQWNDGGGYSLHPDMNLTLFGAGGAIYSNATDLYRFDLALYGEKLINNESKKHLFNPVMPYSWRVGVLPINQSTQPKIHKYDGKIDGFSSMMMRFIDEKHSIILLSNIGITPPLKQQLMLDIASALYNQDVPDRKRNALLALTKGISTGNFEKVLAELKEDKYDLEEWSMTWIANQLLWSGLADKSLQLFSFISNRFSESSTARMNFARACNNELAKTAENKSRICSAEL